MRQKLQDNNEKCKTITNVGRRHQLFNKGDLMMVYFLEEMFPKGTYQKFKYKKIGACKVLKKIIDNAYEIYLLVDLDNNHVFNVFHLYTFQGEDLCDDNEEEVD